MSIKRPEGGEHYKPPNEQPKTKKEPEKSPPELHQKRLTQINNNLSEFNQRATTPEEIRQIQESREQEYDSKISELEQGLGTKLGAESKDMIHQNMVDGVIEQAQRDKERFDNLQRLKKAAETLSPEDFLYFEKILGNQEGRTDQLYDLNNTVMHTTPDFAFQKILESGKIIQDVHRDDLNQVERGVYFTDADSEIGLTFHTLWDDVKSPKGEKAFSSGKYFDPVKELGAYFWSTEEGRKKAIDYVKSKDSNFNVTSTEDLTKFFEQMRKGLETTQGEASGITLLFEKDNLPKLSKDGTNELNRHTELRLYSEDGLEISKVKAIFVPEAKMEKMQRTLQERGLTDIEIRPSEELEVIRTVKLLEEK